MVRRPGKAVAKGSIAVVAAAAILVAVAASAAPGDLDLTFGTGGVATVDFGWDERGVGAVLQPDGKVVVAGSGYFSNVKGFMLARFNGDGTLDTTFGSGGKVHTHALPYVRPRGVALQRDGKILVVGHGLSDYGSDVLLVRYLPNGAVDPAFGVAGLVATDFGGTEEGWAVTTQRDGRIVAAGRIVAIGSGPGDMIAARYLPDGSLDSSFDGDGRVTVGTTTRTEGAVAVAVGKDGKIVLDPEFLA